MTFIFLAEFYLLLLKVFPACSDKNIPKHLVEKCCLLAVSDQHTSYARNIGIIILVSLPRGHFQGIKRMMMLTSHGLFLTCTQKFYLYIYTTHNQLSWA
jgi:hypothetical protein